MLSAIPRVPQLVLPFRFDKLVHAFLFFVLCFLVHRAFFHQTAVRWLRSHSLLLAFAVTVAYGVLDELHQISVPGRTADLYDLLADGTGAMLYVLWIVWKGRAGSRGRKEGME